MTTVTITIPEDLSAQLGPYQDKLDELLRIVEKVRDVGKF